MVGCWILCLQSLAVYLGSNNPYDELQEQITTT